MKIIIIGTGKVGGTLVASLSKERHDIVVIDVNQKRVDAVQDKYDVQGIVGGGCERSVLTAAGADKADLLVACTSKDEVNILCCVIAKKLGAKHTVARVREPDYYGEINSLRDDLGIDMVFNPEKRTAREIYKILRFPSAINVDNFAHGLVSLAEFRIEKGNPLVGKSVMNAIKEYSLNVLFAIVKRENKVIIPHGDFVIRYGDLVNVIGQESDISVFCKKIRIFKTHCKSAFIIGGGKIGFYLSKLLLESGVSVKILEQKAERCKELSEELPGAHILLGDGTDQEVLEEERMDENDACIALTGMDEENVIISLYAKARKMDKIVTKIDRQSVQGTVKVLGLDTVVSPRTITADNILTFVRSLETESESGLKKLYSLYDEVEAIEFIVGETFSGKGVKLRDLDLKNNVLIGGVVRKGQYILPVGDTSFEKGDRVIVVTAVKQIKKLEQILK